MALAAIVSVLWSGCATKRPESAGPTVVAPAPTAEVPELAARKGNVWVVRPDGSKSCGVKKGITPRAAAQELESSGIRVLKQRTGHDGQMRMLVCGADTGNLVELFIDGQGLPTASKKGFRVKGED